MGKSAQSIIERYEEDNQKLKRNISNSISYYGGVGQKFYQGYVKILKVKSAGEVLMRISHTVAWDV